MFKKTILYAFAALGFWELVREIIESVLINVIHHEAFIDAKIKILNEDKEHAESQRRTEPTEPETLDLEQIRLTMFKDKS